LAATLILSGLFALYVPANIKNINKFKSDALISNRFTFDVPYADSSVYNRLYKRSLTFDIFIVRSKDLNNKKLIFLMENIEVLEEGLERAIQFQLDAHNEWERRFVVARLFVDSEITMETINMLKGVFREVGVFRVFFVVMKTADNCNQPQLGEYGFNQKILPKLKSLKDNRVIPKGKSSSPPLVPNFYKNLQSQFINDSLLIIKVNTGRQFILNSDPGKLDQISSALEVKWKPGYRIILECENDVKYSDYIYALASLRKFISRQRNLYSQGYFGKEYYDIYDRDKQKHIKKTVPYYLDFNAEEIKLIMEME